MDDKEKIQSFGDMVDATERLARPWKIICAWLVAALVVTLIATNAIWAYIHFKQLQYAYMTPTEFEQGQNYDEHTQSQSYREGATDGE